MAKGKSTAGGAAVTNRPSYARASFLFQAAALLVGKQAASLTTSPAISSTTPPATTATESKDGAEAAPLQGMARRLLAQMRSVSRKTNMRVRPALKHRVCRYCDTLLVEGTTCVSVVENHSRDGQKPWADVLRVSCMACGRARRHPVSAPRQPRRSARNNEARDAKLKEVELPKENAASNQSNNCKIQQQTKRGKQGKQINTQNTPQQTVVVGRSQNTKHAGGSPTKGPG